MVTSKQIRRVEAWATEKFGLAGMPSDPAHFTSLTGDRVIKSLASWDTFTGMGRAAKIASTTSPLTPADPWRIDSTRLSVVRLKIGRKAASTLFDTQLERGVVFLKSDLTQTGSDFIMLAERDFDADQVAYSQIIVAPYGYAGAVADVVAPSDAAYMAPFVRDVGSSSFTAGARFRLDKLPLSTAARGMDGFAGVGFLLATFAALTGYTGPLLEAVRDTDGARRKFFALADGLFPVTAFRKWAGPGHHVITAWYDLRTGRRHAEDADEQLPFLRFDGPVPSVGGRSKYFHLGSASGPCGAMLANKGQFTLVTLCLSENQRRYQGPSDVFQFGNLNDVTPRFSLRFTPGVHSGRPGGWGLAVRRLDAAATVDSTPIPNRDSAYHVFSADYDWTTDTGRVWVDDPAAGGLTQTDTGLNGSTGNTPDTRSNKVRLGNFPGRLVMAAAIDGAWSNAKQTLLCQRLAAVANMNAVTDDTTDVYCGTQSWFNWPTTVFEAGKTIIGTCTRDAYRHVTELHAAGQRVMVSDEATWAARQALVPPETIGLSDHQPPLILKTSNGKRLLVYVDHADYEGFWYRKSTDLTLANLGAETFVPLPGGSGVLEYVQAFQADPRLVISTQADNRTWGWMRCEDDTATPLVWQTWRPYVVSASQTMYVVPHYKTATTARLFCHTTPNGMANGFKIIDVDLVTGLHTDANGVQLGYWDGTAGNTGKTLPAALEDLPFAITVTTDEAIRITDAAPGGELVVGLRFPSTRTGEESAVACLWKYSAGAWAELPDMPSVGKSFDRENSRFADIVVSRKPGDGIVAYIARRAVADGDPIAGGEDDQSVADGDVYMLERWHSPSGNGGDWSVIKLRRSPFIISNMRAPEGLGADDDEIVMVKFCDDYQNLTNASSSYSKVNVTELLEWLGLAA